MVRGQGRGTRYAGRAEPIAAAQERPVLGAQSGTADAELPHGSSRTETPAVLPAVVRRSGSDGAGELYVAGQLDGEHAPFARQIADPNVAAEGIDSAAADC